MNHNDTNNDAPTDATDCDKNNNKNDNEDHADEHSEDQNYYDPLASDPDDDADSSSTPEENRSEDSSSSSTSGPPTLETVEEDRSEHNTPLRNNRSGNDSQDDDHLGFDFAPVDQAAFIEVPTGGGRLERELNRLRDTSADQLPAVTQARTRGEARRIRGMTLAHSDQDEMTLEDILEEIDAYVNDLPVAQDVALADHPGVSLVTTQFPVKKGLKIFGARGEAAVKKEMKQLHDRRVLKPVHRKNLSREQIGMALSYLMFLKEKRDGTVKGRGCADGRKQRKYTTKSDSTSPTVTTEAVLMTSVIEAHERRDVATVDIPGAFMHADADREVHVRLTGRMAELLAMCDPDMYDTYVIEERGQPVMYARLEKALYGTLRAALLFFLLLSRKLMEWGFVVNPYDWCVVNKIIQGSQCTIIWHVDDLKISHKCAKVVDDIIRQLQDEFGGQAPLTVHRGKEHIYLGMGLDFREEGKVKIDMSKYIQDMLGELDPWYDGTAVTPASANLFTVRQEAEKLAPADCEQFHRAVAQCLFLWKRGRPDIGTAISFLCKRVNNPDFDDKKKLRRVMQYLRATIDIILTLEADNLHRHRWYVDAAFAVQRT